MAQALYEVRLKDMAGAIVARFTGGGRGALGGGLQGFSYHKRLRTPGGFSIRVDGLDERIAYFRLDSGLDYQVEFWRQDPTGGLDWYKDHEGFHRDDEFSQNAEGRDVYVSRGSGYNCLLAAEPIRYAAGSDEACKGGAAETVAKEFVDENVGPSATPVARAMPGLAIELDAGTGNTWPAAGTGCRTNKNLLDVLVELAEYAPGDFMVVGTGAATFEFRWADGQWGLDKTKGNGARPPVVFSSLNNNATNLVYRYSRVNEVNVCYVGGQGKGAQRAYVTRTAAAEGDSPWNRRAVYRDARNAATDDALNASGDEVLNKQQVKRSFKFDVMQTPATRYGRDWEMGDLVTIAYRDVEYTQKVVGIYVTVSADGTESIQPEMEDV